MANKIRIDRDTTSLVVDHYTVHIASKTISLHVLEKDVNGDVIRGQDIGEFKLNAVDINIPDAKILTFLTTKLGLPNNVVPSMDVEVVPPAPAPAVVGMLTQADVGGMLVVNEIPKTYQPSFDGHGLGRLPAADSRDNNFLMRRSLADLGIHESTVSVKSRMWVPGSVLDQGATPTCVAHAWAGFLSASPTRTKVPNLKPVPGYINDPFVMGLYKSAQKVDEWPGEDYEGTSVRAGAKVLKTLGRLSEYIWARDAETVRLHVLTRGPAVIGVNWYSDMFETGEDTPLNVSGNIVGGHALLVIGYSNSRSAFRLLNSWGEGWGAKGRAWLNFSDMQQLLRDEYGEACSATEIQPTEDTSAAH